MEFIGSTVGEMRKRLTPKEEASAPGVQSQIFGSELRHRKKSFIHGNSQ
jgi:hypothetical protein